MNERTNESIPRVFQPAAEETAPATTPDRGDRYTPPMGGGGGGNGNGGFGHDGRGGGGGPATTGPSRWAKHDGGGRSDPRSYPPPRAPSGRPHFSQDGRSGDGMGHGGRDGSPAGYGREDGGYGGQGRPGAGVGIQGQGHRLRESDFPLEMGGGAPKADKTPPLRPRGE